MNDERGTNSSAAEVSNPSPTMPLPKAQSSMRLTCFGPASINGGMPMAQEQSGPVLVAASSDHSPASALKSVLLPAACLIVAGGLAYFNSFQAPFFLDDERAIVKNPTIRRLARVREVLSPPQGSTVEGRPMVNLSLAISYAMGGLHVFPYHAMNLAVHILAALTLFGLVSRTLLRIGPSGERVIRQTNNTPLSRPFTRSEATWLGLTVALLWLLHPLQTESVTYIIQRAESLMGLLYLLTLYMFVRGACAQDAEAHGRDARGTYHDRPGRGPWLGRTSLRWYLGAIAACALGMGTKEVMVSAPLMALLYDRTFLSGSFSESLRRRWGCYAGLAATWLVLLAALASSGGHREVIGLHFAELTPLHYAMTQCRFLIHYLALVFWPSDLVFDYGLADAGVPIIRTWAECAPWGALVLALLCGTLLALRYLPALGFLGAWFFLILAPTSSFVPIISQVAAEHRMYLPLAAVVCGGLGILDFGFWILDWLGSRGYLPSSSWDSHPNPESKIQNPKSKALLVALAGLAVLSLGYRTILRNEDYASRERMWRLVVAQRPGNPRALNNLGKILSDQGRLKEGAAFLEAALQADARHANPDETAITHNNLGIILSRQGRLGEAIAHCQEALKLWPRYPEAHYNLGNALFQQGKLDEAMAHYREALQLKPEYAEARTNLGAALFQRGKLDEAIAEYQEALKEMPEYVEAHNNLGAALAKQGRRAEAIAQFREALRLKPDCREAKENLAEMMNEER